MPETSSFNSLTVIIPTYNRKTLLAKALAAYASQSFSYLIHELLVVDDGSNDGTENMVREFSSRAPFTVRYLRQVNKGPAAARNFGIREASSSVVLFTDSDIIPGRNLVEQHIQWHRQNPGNSAAVLGYVTWCAEVKPTPFMRWYGEDGMLFGYRLIRDQHEVDFHSFYTCNVSLKTDFLRSCGYFDENFKTAAFEDTELGYRLSRHGLRLLYNPQATGYHHQFFSFEEACRKVRANAAAAQLFFQKEAGQQIWKEIQQKRSRARYHVAKRVAAALMVVLSPARPLMDSRVPLPRIVYRLFYWHEMNRTLDVARTCGHEAIVQGN
jgi:glycosyltransferase involved in cell wall biosynthesis